MTARNELRKSLLALRFDRMGYTQAHGADQYEETWSNGTDAVVIKWGPRPVKPLPPKLPPPVIEPCKNHDCCQKSDEGLWFCPNCGEYEDEVENE